MMVLAISQDLQLMKFHIYLLLWKKANAMNVGLLHPRNALAVVPSFIAV